MVAHSGGMFYCACEEDGYPCQSFTTGPYCAPHAAVIGKAIERDTHIAIADTTVRTLAAFYTRRAQRRGTRLPGVLDEDGE